MRTIGGAPMVMWRSGGARARASRAGHGQVGRPSPGHRRHAALSGRGRAVRLGGPASGPGRIWGGGVTWSSVGATAPERRRRSGFRPGSALRRGPPGWWLSVMTLTQGRLLYRSDPAAGLVQGCNRGRRRLRRRRAGSPRWRSVPEPPCAQPSSRRRDHALLAGRAGDLRARRVRDREPLDLLGHRHDLVDGHPPLVARARARRAAGGPVEGGDLLPRAPREPGGDQLDLGRLVRLLALVAQPAREALGHHAVERRADEERLDAHLDEPA